MSQALFPRPKPSAPKRPRATYAMNAAVVIDRPGHSEPIYGRVCGAPGAGGFIPVNYLTEAGTDSVWLADPAHITEGWA